MNQTDSILAVGVESADSVIAATRAWLEKAVIGLGLCPFAKGVYRGNRVRYFVSQQQSATGLIDELAQELAALQSADPSECETTLLIHPQVLGDFGDYNDFLEPVEELVAALGLRGELQVASFHPHYQFAGTAVDDIENYTNRSPYPMLHLLRETSIDRAVAEFPEVDAIGATNIATLNRLGIEGWRRLWQ